MQKVKTIEYEVLARMLSSRELYEIRWDNKVYISYVKDLIWRGYGNEEILNRMSQHIVCKAHTVRGAWKKACKVLNQI